MINFDYITGGNKIEHNPKWPYIPNHSHKMFIIGGTGLGKTNLLLNPIKLNEILINLIHMLKIHIKLNICCLVTNAKV